MSAWVIVAVHARPRARYAGCHCRFADVKRHRAELNVCRLVDINRFVSIARYAVVDCQEITTCFKAFEATQISSQRRYFLKRITFFVGLNKRVLIAARVGSVVYVAAFHFRHFYCARAAVTIDVLNCNLHYFYIILRLFHSEVEAVDARRVVAVHKIYSIIASPQVLYLQVVRQEAQTFVVVGRGVRSVIGQRCALVAIWVVHYVFGAISVVRNQCPAYCFGCRSCFRFLQHHKVDVRREGWINQRTSLGLTSCCRACFTFLVRESDSCRAVFVAFTFGRRSGCG